MKMTVVLKCGTVEVSSDNQMELFQEAASAHEVFGEQKCGLCGNEDIRPSVRNVAGEGKGEVFTYHEYVCQDPKCRAKLSLGQSRDKIHLFPIRQLTADGRASRKDGKYGPHNGWSKFAGNPTHDDAPAPRQQAPAPAAPVPPSGRGGATNGRLPQQETRGRGKPAADEGDGVPF